MTAAHLLSIVGVLLAVRGSYLNRKAKTDEDKSNATFTSLMAIVVCTVAMFLKYG